jgi:hypothetical protein
MPISSIDSTFALRESLKPLLEQGPQFGAQIAQEMCPAKAKTLMPQEISVSYQAIKSKIYRLIDALVVGDKNESEVQESVRRWWGLIHPADRPVAQKYLQMVLGRSTSALDAVEVAMLSVEGSQVVHSQVSDAQLSTRRLRLLERLVKEAGAQPTA